MKPLSFMMLLFLTVIVISGCGEEAEESAITELTAADGASFGTVAEMKEPAEMAPGAPSAPTDGTPFVKSVRYYSDWKLTEELDSEKPVPVGSTIFIHIVFSEAMKHRVTDNTEKKGALPVLRYWVNSEVTRFRMMQHGASGEDFRSGDAKPKGGGTDDFVCKYKVGEEDKGSLFWIRVGEWSMDLEWNKLKASYIHQTKLKLGKVSETTQEQPEEKVVVEDDEVKKEPEPPTVAPADTTPPTVISVTHYRDSDGSVIPEGESVEHNTTINTEIMFSEPIDPKSIVVTYTTGGKTGRYSYSTGGVHWRGLFQVGKDNKSILCKQDAREDAFVVTLEAAKDLAGNTLTEPVTTPELTVTPRPVVTTPEPTQPTEPQTPVDTTPTTGPDDPTSGDIVDLGYTYTLEGETYPGYNPSPGLQHILDTHPSAKLPHFLEAVQMVEVIDWVVRKSWRVYPDRDQASINQIGTAWTAVDAHFGLPEAIDVLLLRIYFKNPQGKIPPGHSLYWLIVEYLRLKLEHPKANEDQLLFNLFVNSTNNGWIVGLTNPND